MSSSTVTVAKSIPPTVSVGAARPQGLSLVARLNASRGVVTADPKTDVAVTAPAGRGLQGPPGPAGPAGDIGPVGPTAFSILSAWAPGADYSNVPPISSVIADGAVWVCTADHTSGLSFDVDYALGLWVPLTPRVTGRYGGTF